jgi:hypothetical protein
VGFEQAARHDSDEKEGREEREAVQVVVSDTAMLEGLLGEVRKYKVIAGEHLSARRSFCRKSPEADLSYAPHVCLDSRQASSYESSPSDSYLVRVFISSISLVSERSTDGHFTFRLGFYHVRTSPARRAPLLPLLSRSRKPSQPHVTSDSNLPSSSSDPELASYANDEFRREFISAETFRRVSSWTSSKQVNIRVCTFMHPSRPPLTPLRNHTTRSSLSSSARLRRPTLPRLTVLLTRRLQNIARQLKRLYQLPSTTLTRSPLIIPKNTTHSVNHLLRLPTLSASASKSSTSPTLASLSHQLGPHRGSRPQRERRRST